MMAATNPQFSRPTRSARWVAALSTLACLAALGVAFGSERWLGLNPCAFCLLERRPYEIGGVSALLALMMPATLARMLMWVVLAALLCAVGLSAVHVGVEQHWWPDPLPACTVPDFTGMTAAQRIAAMPLRPAKPCEDPDFPVPGLPVSMAQMGLAYALAISLGLAMLLFARRGRRFS